MAGRSPAAASDTPDILILVDTSAWIEFLRATGTRAHLRLRSFLEDGAPLATSEVIVMEVLAGARDEAHRRTLRRLLLRYELLPFSGLADYETAADLYGTCRRAGETIRALTSCLIAVPAIRAGAPVLHADRDFDAIARHSALTTISLADSMFAGNRASLPKTLDPRQPLEDGKLD